jgi:hypothetical protein
LLDRKPYFKVIVMNATNPILLPVRLRNFLCAFVLLLSLVMHAQQNSRSFVCSYYGEEINSEVRLAPANDAAKAVIEKILSVVGLRPNFEIRAANVPNAAAVILNNKRYILYNPEFIADINNAAGNNWAGISIIAHEIGHHLNGHTLESGGSRPELELEADEFSGFVLCKLGAGIKDAQAAMNVAASQKSSHTHPARKDRLVSIADGWKNASGQLSGTASVSKSDKTIVKPVIPANPKTEPSALDEKYIAFDVHFNADKQGQYYITIRGNLVNVENDSIYLIGRLAESNKRGYKLMLSDKNYNYLYIAPKGDIVNGVGKKVGEVNTHN